MKGELIKIVRQAEELYLWQLLRLESKFRFVTPRDMALQKLSYLSFELNAY